METTAALSNSRLPQSETRTPGELSAAEIFHACDPASLNFTSTDELPDLQNVIGQPRALRALELGSEISGPGYNLFVLGLPGSGRTTLSQEYLQRKAARQPVPEDWCYVYNFENPYTPRALRLPPGKAGELHKDMQQLLEYCEREIPKAFETQEYVQDREMILAGLNKSQAEGFTRLQEHVAEFQFILVRTSSGVILTPSMQGRPLAPDDVEKLTPEQREKLEKLAVKLSEEVERTLAHLREMGRAAAQQVEELNRRTALFHVEPVIRKIKEKYASAREPDPAQESGGSASSGQAVSAYLDAVQADLCLNAIRFKTGGESEAPSFLPAVPWTQRYLTNVLVNHRLGEGAPVILESQPSYQNLVGRIEHEVVMGAVRTDFTMIRPGALHRANGGYLLLPARDLLTNPYAWEGLKRVLRDGSIRILELSNQIGLVSTQTLEPEPIPLEVKVLLIGTPLMYYLLRLYDEDFPKLFRV